MAALAHGGPSVALLAGLVPGGPARLLGSRLRVGPAGTGRGEVALTFDDGPSPSTTPAVLDALDEHGLRATFFLLGEAVAAAPELAVEVARRGHEVACHGMAHHHHLLWPPGAVAADTAAAVRQLRSLGLGPRFYRPPYGQVAAATLVAARTAGCEVVLWSAWGREFAEAAPEPVLGRLAAGLRAGAIVLLHDSDACSPAGTTQRTLAVLPGLAEVLARRDLRARPLGEVLG